ncbi:flagellar motor switch protein FliM [Rhizobium sp. RU35A]|uniref:FliM/FliN family flagellar motor switch protein n=1 Tax=Rhizobium sp. RU35A TaxID=1907414 RepID=UPI000956798F|nr:FliM/FliN family flagellar motor switch protein [Rhizobium sp. RU35A]SIQ02818.1 flagellar motor switch protein FliM [Rhizobium sp. RU35A]
MSDEQNSAVRIDHALLAKLTNGLGDRKTVEKICGDFGQLYSVFLPDVFHSETGIGIEVSYVGFQSGLMRDLIAELGDTVSFSDGQLRNWCPNFVLACGSGFVIALMERMLGAEESMVQQPPERPLSDIELDLATMVFERIANVLRSGVNAAGSFEPLLERPHNAGDRPPPDPEAPLEYGATIRLAIDLGKVTSEIALIIPQRALLKTKVVVPKPKGQVAKNRQEWHDKLMEQVHRSQVTLEARIRLQTLALQTISRLAVGDVIPFEDKDDVKVQVRANGKDMYNCEFGRSGERYTVRVRDNVSTEDELIRHLIG